MSEGDKESTDAVLGNFDPRVSQAYEDAKGGSESAQTNMEKDIQLLKKENDELRDQIEDQNKLKEKLHDEITSLKSQHQEEMKRLSEEHADVLQAQSEELQRIRNQAVRRAQTEQNQKAINELKNENEALKRDIEEADKKSNLYKERKENDIRKFKVFLLVAVITAIAMFIALVFSITQMKASCNIYITQKNQLEVEVNLMKDKVGNLDKTNMALKTKYRSLEVELSSKDDVNKRLQNDKVKLIKDMEQVKSQNDQLEDEKKNLEANMTNLETKKKSLEFRVKELKQEMHADVDDIQTKLSECLTSLHKGAVTRTDLSPITLGQQYRIIYEQHYTMAIEEMENLYGESDIKQIVVMFLNILKTAHQLAAEYTKRHIDSMIQSTTVLEVPNSGLGTQGDMEKLYANGSLSQMDWKDFYEVRQNCAWRMMESITTLLGDIIAKEFKVNIGSQPKMMTYIKECVGLCWKMHMHLDPIFIDFYEPEGTVEFDFETFKPFLYRKGNYLDYVVWPPMYEKRGGQMISKGTAERKE